MIELVFYGIDYQAFLKEAHDKGLSIVGKDENGYVIRFTKTPTKVNSDGDFGFFALLTQSQVEEFSQLITIEELGTAEDIKKKTKTTKEKAKRKKYDKIHSTEPIKIKDENGVESTHIPPEIFGSFAIINKKGY